MTQYYPASLSGAIMMAARQGRLVRKWKCDFIPGVGPSVMALPEMVFNIPERKIVYVTSVVVGLHDATDWIRASVGWCTQIDGGGVYRQASRCHYVYTGNVRAENTHRRLTFEIPVVARYSQGARSVSMCVYTNAADTPVTVGWAGFYE